ncbi:MAG: response regulator transcription factor [Firmicutes bacterium]|jgi:two-component system response regulator RegX3|nr:response regulator transcription factor [Bacillota bacterium]NBI63600.1 DNA-binding response regulator [Clostridiales bacterium]
MKYDCLIIDDEEMLADSTAEYFNLFGVKTAVAYSASQCRTFFRENTAGLLLLDINLGDASGFALCKELRKKTEIPILFISARTSDDDKIVALNIGGDDYVQKPYSLGVLLAKVKVVLKRYGKSGEERSQYADGWLTVDFDARQTFVQGNPVKLTSLEFKLLSYLMKQENKVISKQELFAQVWQDKFTGDGTLNVHIRKIREAIEREPSKPQYIVTVWGDGYMFKGGRP